MPIQLGNTNITKAYLGATEVTQAYLGDVLVFGGAVSTDFIITIKTDNSGTSLDTQFTFPITTGTCDIDWGDGNTSLGVSGNQTHTYALAGTYDISVTGGLTRTRIANGGDPLKLIDVKNWGDIAWGSNQFGMFANCLNLIGITATDIPDFSSAVDFGSFFSNSGLVSIDVTNWSFPIATQFDGMFSICSSLTTIIGLDTWDVSNVNNMNQMFRSCPLLTNLNVSNWNTGSVTNMLQMLYACLAFDEDISAWDITSVTNFSGFMRAVGSSGLSTTNYDKLLIGWASQVPQLNQNPHFSIIKYTLGGAAEAARNTLINTYGWTITDGGGI
jgi:surface protein